MEQQRKVQEVRGSSPKTGRVSRERWGCFPPSRRLGHLLWKIRVKKPKESIKTSDRKVSTPEQSSPNPTQKVKMAGRLGSICSPQTPVCWHRSHHSHRPPKHRSTLVQGPWVTWTFPALRGQEPTVGIPVKDSRKWKFPESNRSALLSQKKVASPIQDLVLPGAGTRKPASWTLRMPELKQTTKSPQRAQKVR